MFEDIRIAILPKRNEIKYIDDLILAMDMVDRNGRNHDDLGRFSREIGSPKEWGESFSEYSGKPEEAIDKLLKEKRGYVPKAIYKHGIGDIDFVWGEAGERGTGEGYGLSHIIRRRNEENFDGYKFTKSIPSIIKHGKIYKDPRFDTRIYVETKDKSASIRLDWNGEDKIWLVSAWVKR